MSGPGSRQCRGVDEACVCVVGGLEAVGECGCVRGLLLLPPGARLLDPVFLGPASQYFGAAGRGQPPSFGTGCSRGYKGGKSAKARGIVGNPNIGGG